MKTVIALVAFAGTASVSQAQFVDVVVNGGSSATVSGGIVDVSLFLDRDRSTSGFFSSFAGWSTFGGRFTSDAGSWIGGTESTTESTGLNPFAANGPDTWTFGRRPAGFAPVGNGSFRYPNPTSNALAYQGGSTLELSGGGTFEGLQAGPTLGNIFADTTNRIEVFRAQIDFTGVTAGTYDVAFELSSLAIGFGSLDIVRQVIGDATVMNASVTVTPPAQRLIPAPSSAAILGLSGLIATRRRR
ncbi:MAG: hypothetical protein AAGG07_01265 [Planctomycetota bacterium]